MKLNSLRKYCLFLNLVTLGFLLGSHSAVHSRSIQTDGADFHIDMAEVQGVLSLLSRNANVAIVTFQTEITESFRLKGDNSANGKKVYNPSTTVIIMDNKKVAIQVKGTFGLEKVLNGTIPKLGRVDSIVELAQGFPMLHRDESFRRLERLIPNQTVDAKTPPRKFLAIWPTDGKNILSAKFVGPITDRNVEEITEMAEFLKKNDLSKIAGTSAVELLESNNPWMIYLGLARLTEQKQLTPKNFTRAIESLPKANTQEVTYQLLSWAYVSNDKQEAVTSALIEFLGKSAPEKEKLALVFINQFWRQDPTNVQRQVNLSELQKAAQSYRDKIANVTTRKDVIHELDALIGFRPEKK